MKERKPVTPLTEGVDMITCRRLYEATGGYEADGGRYDAAQSFLLAGRWRYDIALDAWIAPWRWMMGN
jgi:hypothetical protein